MRLIYFLNISLCLFFNAAVSGAAELEQTGWRRSLWLDIWRNQDAKQDNPLKQLQTYLDNSGKFTLAKAEALINQQTKEEKDIVNYSGTGSTISPLRWLVINGFKLNQILTQENRVNIAQLLITHGTNEESLQEAFFDCEAEVAPHHVEANTSIKKLLYSVKTEKEIEIDEVKLDKLRKFKRGLWSARKARKNRMAIQEGGIVLRQNYYPPRHFLTLANIENGPSLRFTSQAKEIYDQIKLNHFEIKKLLGEGLTLTEIKEMTDREF